MIALLAALALAPNRPLIMVHYMPWFESKPFSGEWGWHWTMNHFDPNRTDGNGRRQIASRYYPLIGAYDSADPAALECQCRQMKAAGIDGLFIDWYGINDLYDYTRNNRCTELMMKAADKYGLKYAVVYEDQTLSSLIKNNRVAPEHAVQTGATTMHWLQGHFFSRPGYLKLGGRPVLLNFGPQFFKEADWSAMFASLKPRPAFYTELGPKGPAIGAFGWPEPQVGDAQSWTHLQGFYDRAKAWRSFIGVAYPRFEDIYAQAGVHASWGTIEDRDGATFRNTLELAEKSNAPFVQIATWNDWGEGTQIEPSVEFGYRDLLVLQKLRRKQDPSFTAGREDLKRPTEAYLTKRI